MALLNFSGSYTEHIPTESWKHQLVCFGCPRKNISVAVPELFSFLHVSQLGSGILKHVNNRKLEVRILTLENIYKIFQSWIL